MKNLGNDVDKAELVRRLQMVSPDSPPRWGKMTAHQMICHVTDSYRGPMGEKEMGRAEGWHFRKLMKWVALSLPFPWPKNLGTLPEMDQRRGGTRPLGFEADLTQLKDAMERFSTRDADFAWRPHPIFIDMSLGDWMRWGYLHMEHHLRQFGA